MSTLFDDTHSHSVGLPTIMNIRSFPDFFKPIRPPPVDWVSFELDGKPIPDVSWQEVRSFCLLNPRTINVYIAQLRDFYIYVLHKDWDILFRPYFFRKNIIPKPLKHRLSQRILEIGHILHHTYMVRLYPDCSVISRW